MKIPKKTASQRWSQLHAHQEHHNVSQVNGRALRTISRKLFTTRDVMPQIRRAVEAVHKIGPNAQRHKAHGVLPPVKTAALETTATQDHHTASTK